MAIHQNHDYFHHPGGYREVFYGVEAKRNLKLAGGTPFVFTLEDATHVLTPTGLKPNLSRDALVRRIRVFPVLHPRIRFLVPAVKVLIRLSRPVRARLGLGSAGERKEVRP
jgi:hypothetical protein